MPTAASSASPQYQALYRATVQEAAAGGHMLMGKLVAAARQTLQAREAACRDLRERDALAQSGKQLRAWEAKLCERYPHALLEAFTKPETTRKAGSPLAITDVGFDELELMDEVQVLTSVTLARTQQVAMLAAEASLAELNTLICSTLGLGVVNADRNPLRPQVYISALKAVVEQTGLPPAMQLDWLSAMSTTLGQELRAMYTQLCTSLQNQGVVAAGYMVVQTASAAGAGGYGVGRGVAQDAYLAPSLQTPAGMPVAAGHAPPVASAPPAAPKDATLLTLEKLRRLLSGELEAPQVPLSPMEQFAQRFSREFESDVALSPAPASDFDATVPAALEALKEMQQVDEVVQRLQQRRGAAAAPAQAGDTSVEAVRAQLRSHSRSVGQSLSLEVITLMVDNIARDGRLLAPVQQLIRRLEPPLLRLALVDPRLFTNKQHPARVLVQELADYSQAFASPQAKGFAEFVSGVEQAFAMLNQAPIESAEPFEQVLHVLREEWNEAKQRNERSHDQAVQALQNAEERNVLAEKIAQDIAALRDAQQVPPVVLEFLCGPWAQVVAQARLAGPATAGSPAERYQSLVSALLWSTHPDLGRKDTPKLTRLVPPLLGTLREGLDTIHYPSVKTSAFFEALMGLHQRAFRAEPKSVAQPAPVAPEAGAATAARIQLVDDGNPWVAPEEARASNFMDLPDAPAERPSSSATPAAVATTPDKDGAGAGMTIGCWVELLVNGQWVRTQLTWISSHASLFLFTSAVGEAQSMTRRSRDKLVAAGQLRVISGTQVVDGALNAVAQMAMRNSVNSTF